MNEAGEDNGLRFVDLNEDGFADVIFSNAERYSVHLFSLNEPRGWSREIISGKGSGPREIPMIARGGKQPNNGTWFHSRHMWIQNEETAALPNIVDRRSFDELQRTSKK